MAGFFCAPTARFLHRFAVRFGVLKDSGFGRFSDALPRAATPYFFCTAP
jgi:hypothetical protein